MNNLYPVTIMKARYSGTYEGGSWVAFNCYPSELPPEATADDVTCATWWTTMSSTWVGRGDSPDEAHADLQRRLQENEPPGMFLKHRRVDYQYNPND